MLKTNNKTVKEIFTAYEKQIKKDMDFWIKYRPSRWVDYLPENFIRPLLKFIKTKGRMKLLIILTIIFNLIFVGFLPTLIFIWSNIFKLWLILLIIPLFYWIFAITSVYTRVIAQGFCKFVRAVLVDF